MVTLRTHDIMIFGGMNVKLPQKCTEFTQKEAISK